MPWRYFCPGLIPCFFFPLFFLIYSTVKIHNMYITLDVTKTLRRGPRSSPLTCGVMNKVEHNKVHGTLTLQEVLVMEKTHVNTSANNLSVRRQRRAFPGAAGLNNKEKQHPGCTTTAPIPGHIRPDTINITGFLYHGSGPVPLLLHFSFFLNFSLGGRLVWCSSECKCISSSNDTGINDVSHSSQVDECIRVVTSENN